MTCDTEKIMQQFDACLPLARAYVPLQRVSTLFNPFEALRRGTIFPELAQTYTRRVKAIDWEALI